MRKISPMQGINLALLGLAALPGFSQNAKSKNIKPNILFIAVDDLKPLLSCYGDKFAKTPNIDRLANQGTVFMNNYCQQAVSGPTRASLMTGKRPDYTQVWDLVTVMRDKNPDIVTIPQYFINQGYATAGIGKIFHPGITDKKEDAASWSIPYLLADNYYAKGFGMPLMKHYQNPSTKALIEKYQKEAVDSGMKKKAINEYISKRIKLSNECIDIPDNAYEDGAMALAAKDQLIKFSKDNGSFFFAVGFHKPHLPFVSPKKYWDLYKRDEMPLAKYQQHAENSPDFAYTKAGELKNYTDIPEYCTFTDSQNKTGMAIDKQKEMIQGYYAAVSYMDAQVGILLNTLDSLGMLKNTIIVLWGDHGWHLGDHDLWCKHTNFENATRSTLIISAPGLKAGQTNSMSEFVDVFPTLCDLSGVGIPTYLDGKSLVPLMKDKKASVKDYSMSQYPRSLKKAQQKKEGLESGDVMGYSLRTSRYRYTVWMSNAFRSNQPYNEKNILATELYDYEKDPLETINVSQDKNYEATVKDLKGKMIGYFKSQEYIGAYKVQDEKKKSNKKINSVD